MGIDSQANYRWCLPLERLPFENSHRQPQLPGRLGVLRGSLWGFGWEKICSSPSVYGRLLGGKVGENGGKNC